MSAAAFLADRDTDPWVNPLCFPPSVFPRLAETSDADTPTAEAVEATLTDDEKLEVFSAWGGRGARDPIVSAMLAEGITATTDIARELVSRARRILAERAAAREAKKAKEADELARRRAQMTADSGDRRTPAKEPVALSGKGNTGLSDSQDSQDTQDSQRNTSLPGGRSTDSGLALVPSAEEEKAEEEDPVRKCNRDRLAWYADFVNRPFAEFVTKAWELDNRRKKTGEFHEWQGQIFYFAWLLRGHADMQPYLSCPAKALPMVEYVMTAWTRTCRAQKTEPHFGFHKGDVWLEWFAVDRPDARAEFADTWAKARYTPGKGPLQQAVDAARRMRLLLPDNVRDKRPLGDPGQRDEKDYEFFISVAGHLQTIVGDNDIILPCHALAEVMGTSTRTIARYRSWAVDDDFLRVTAQHKLIHPKSGNNSATQFRFDVGIWKPLSEKAQNGTAESFTSARPGKVTA